MSITIVIIVVTVLISFYSFNRRDIMARLMMNPYMIMHRREYYRVVTSGFIHKDHMHLLFNMFTLYFFGEYVERIFDYVFGAAGPAYFVILYVSAIVVSDLTTLHKHKDNPRYNSLGASGAVSALVFVFILFLPLEELCLYVFICMPGFILGALYIVYSYTQAKRNRDFINHDAHLFGAIYGVLFCVILYPSSITIFIEQISNWSLFQAVLVF